MSDQASAPVTRLRLPTCILLMLATAIVPAVADLLPLTNPGFENNSLSGSGDFKGSSTGAGDPLGWVRVVPSGCVAGVIGETRAEVANTPDGVAWAHLQTNQNAANAPRIGQRVGALADSVFSDPANPNLWVHFLASRRINENRTVHVTASLYAVPAAAADWSSGTLVGSSVFSTELANLTDGDPGSIAQAGLVIPLDNATAQAAHPGGDYWLVLANTLSGNASPFPQLVLDRVTAQTGDDNNPGPQDPPQPAIDPSDQVAGDLILFNDNGGWCWYQDERVIVDRDNDSLVIASVANYLGFGGEPRDGDMDVVTFTPETGKRTLMTLGTVPTLNKGDDHNVAALWQRPDGRYFAKHTGHNYGAGYNDTVDWGDDNVPRSFYRTTTQPNDGSTWVAEQAFTWPKNGTFEDDITYTNLHFLSAEGTGQGRLYNIARADDRTPHIAWSDDQGVTWSYGGRLSSATSTSTYSNGYFVFTSNGVDRIDFMCTEHHPRDYNNSIYHGYIQSGKSYNSFGTVIDDNIFDQSAPTPQQFTLVWATSPSVSSTSYHHAWTMELELAPGGIIHGLFTTRYGTAQATERIGDADHRLFYARFDGSTWSTNELCKMGNSLDGKEGDYTGLGSIDPNDPSTIYISAEHDPRNATPLPKHEIFKGVTQDQGENWTWTPITWNSTVENLRPVVPKWKDGHTALLWLRGRYPFQRDYDQSVVGLIERSDEKGQLVTYLDADLENTTRADGTSLSVSGPSAADGPAEGQWHLHAGLGNGATALTANGSGNEDVPPIKTSITDLADGSYDVYVFFWSPPGSDWRIRAGFSIDDLLVFRRYSCQQAEEDQFDAPVSVLDSSRALYRAYVGRRTITGGEPIDVLIDDFDGTTAAGSERTAYDGIGVARVLPVLQVQEEESLNLPADSGPYDSIINKGSMILKGETNLEVVGTFINDGFLDLLSYFGSLPVGFVNNGSSLDLTSADLVSSIAFDGNNVSISIPGYAGHSYQLQSSTTLRPDDWHDIGIPAQGSGHNGVSIPLGFNDTGPLLGSKRKFYRLVID